MTTDNSSLYNDAVSYDRQYADYTRDLEFWAELARELGGDQPVVEFACGSLRVTIPVASAGVRVTGVDLSEPMLALGKQKLAKQPADVKKRVRLYQGDMRTFRTQQCGGHHLVTVPFTAFLHMNSQPDQIAALRNFREHLVAGGHLLVDIFSPDVTRLAAATRQMTPVVEKQLVDTVRGETLVRSMVASYAPATQLMDWTFFVSIYDRETGAKKSEHRESATVQLIFPQEWRLLLQTCGFRVVEEWGDFDRSPFSGVSPRMLFLAQKI